LACPIRQVVSRFGDKWSMLVLCILHTSETGILRFNEIRRLMSPEGHLKRKSTCEELVSA
jgi:DNA-binding HxlR family transcriptional regulator